MTPRHLAIAAATVLTAAACSDSNSPTSDCPKPVTVTVSAGTKPAFSWTPACKAYVVSVHSSSGLVWAMGFNDQNPAKANVITSPVTYGDSLTIGDSLVKSFLAELTAGQTYTVFVLALTPVGTTTQMGKKDFVPEAAP